MPPFNVETQHPELKPWMSLQQASAGNFHEHDLAE